MMERMTPNVVLVAKDPLHCHNTIPISPYNLHTIPVKGPHLPPRICSRVLTTSSGDVSSAAIMPPTAPPTKCRYEYAAASGTRALVAAAAVGGSTVAAAVVAGSAIVIAGGSSEPGGVMETFVDQLGSLRSSRRKSEWPFHQSIRLQLLSI